MFDFNEELILEVYNVRWMIWVQLLVAIFLLCVLFCGFGAIFGDLFNNPTSPSSSISSISSSSSRGNKSLPNGPNPLQVEEFHRVERDMDDDSAGTSKGSDRSESREREISVKDAALLIPFGQAESHMRSFLGLAKEAILKCLGLDALFENSIKKRHLKD